MSVRIAASSVEYLWVPVRSVDILDDTARDISGTTPTVAIKAHGTDPDPGDYAAATWEPGGTRTIAGDAYYLARVLVGTGSDIGALTAGSWDVWVKVVDSPETPAELADTITVY